MGMAAAAVVADLTGAELVPRLCHVQEHAVLSERLEGEDGVRGDLREEAGIGIAVGVGRLLVAVEFPERNFANNAQTFVSVTIELPAALGTTVAIARRLHDKDTDSVD